MNNDKITVILGAGPAGLAAGYELSKKFNQKVILIEKEPQVGGMSGTKKFSGHLIDFGPHRFFSKNKEVKDLWSEVLGPDFIEVPRLTRIFYKNKFFNYPLKIKNTLLNLGLVESGAVFFSILSTKLKNLFSKKKDVTFEDFVSRRFGNRLFSIFFKSYTEKLWGISTKELSAQWASQRIKDLSISTILKNLLFGWRKARAVSLIEKFNYPKLGAGMMYEKISDGIIKAGGEVVTGSEVKLIKHHDNKITSIILIDENGMEKEIKGDNFISSIPINEMINSFDPKAPKEVIDAADSLKFRSLVIVSLVVASDKIFPDNWIYIHDPSLKVTRMQNNANWGPHLSEKDNETVLNLEYACWENDDFWSINDNNLVEIAKSDLKKIQVASNLKVFNGLVSRLPHAYPVYAFDYENNLNLLFGFLKKFENFQTIGRSGMFHYNNMDHSILSGVYAARNLMGENYDILNINTDGDYHEVDSEK